MADETPIADETPMAGDTPMAEVNKAHAKRPALKPSPAKPTPTPLTLSPTESPTDLEALIDRLQQRPGALEALVERLLEERRGPMAEKGKGVGVPALSEAQQKIEEDAKVFRDRTAGPTHEQLKESTRAPECIADLYAHELSA